ncbi:hypothetical protein AB0395_22075 [Streptosporangium sp. NPDC051023]|uniref:hypothetical protein n=1 Tax=Streptosporangium sp. NPDC051023 TaxID=3155410 RepID=UPI00344EB2F5
MTASTSGTEELRELIREAHGLLKDLRAERRAVVELIDSIPARVDGRIEEHLKDGLEQLGAVTKAAMDTSVAKVTREFDRLEAIFKGADPASRRAGKRPLEDLIRTVAPTTSHQHNAR